MSKLKLGAIESDKAVRLSIRLSAALHRDLVAYAKALAAANQEETLDPAKIIPAMVERFMATDRGFAKFRKETAGRPSQETP